jgi:RHS repeat-associated protein
VITSREIRTVAEFDVYGRKLSLDDPDGGLESYVWNGFDELELVTDGRGTVTELEHDALGRLQVRRHLDQFGPGNHGESVYEWDGGSTLQADELIGQMTRAISADGVEQRYSFDASSGRLDRVRTMSDGFNFDVDYAYDSFGRVDSVTYPQGPAGSERLSVRNVYDTYGNVMGLANANAPATEPLHWALLQTSLEGAIQREQYGNGVTTNRTYYDDGRSRRIAHQLGGQPIQTFEYVYDASGNLQSRADLVNSQIETMAYDEHDRLRMTTDGGGQWFAYDNAENLHPDSVNASYRYDGPRPHALTTDGTSTFEYDGAGNRTSRITPERTYRYDYTPFNKLRSIEREEEGETELVGTLEYDAFDGRAVQTNIQGTVHYALGMYERRHREGQPVEHVFYIGAPGRAVAQIIWSEGGEPQAFYFHDDHLGSTSAISPQSISNVSTDVVQQSFRAFGERRSPTDWSLPDPWAFPDPRFSSGFTGHEADHLFGLTNMRGRMYDPSTRQFLSPDPYMQVPFGEGLNRYSYVSNNPLTYVDPSGYEIVQTVDGPMNVTWGHNSVQFDLVTNFNPALYAPATIGPLPIPSLSADAAHYQHLTPAQTRALTGGIGFESSNLTLASEANPNFKNYGDLGIAYLFLPIEIIDWLCLDGQCGPGAPTAAVGAIKELAKRGYRSIPHLMGRVRALGADPRRGFILAEGIGGVRIEMALGRTITRSADEAADFVDDVLGPISLKGPLPTAARGNVQGLATAAINDALYNTATKALFVDLRGLDSAAANQVRALVEAGTSASVKPITFLP